MTQAFICSQRFRVLAIFLAATLFALSVIEISPVRAACLVIVCLVLSNFGRLLARSGGFGEIGLGVGLVLGLGAHVFGSQILLHLGLAPDLSHGVAIVILLTAVFWFRKTSSFDMDRVQSFAVAEAFAALSVAMLVFSFRHPWALPFGISLAVIERFSSRRATILKTSHMVLLLISLALGWLVAIISRSSKWWYLYLTGETGYFEAIGWVTSQFGISEHPGLSGGSIAGYHWMSYTFLGSISQLLALEPWDAIAKIGLPLSQFALASILLRSPRSDSAISISHIAWLGALIVVAGTAQVRYDSSYFGLVSALAVLVLALQFKIVPRIGTISVLVFLLVALTAVMAKTPSAIAVGVVLGLGVLASRRNITATSLMPLSLLVCAGVGCYILFFRQSPYTSASTAGASNSLSTTFWISLNGVPYLGWTLAILTLLVIIPKPSRPTTSVVPQVLIWCAATSWLSFNAVSIVADHGYQMANPSLFMVGVLAVWGIQSRLQDTKPRTFTGRQKLMASASLVMGSGIGFAFPVFANRINATLDISGRVGSNAWEFIGDHAVYLIPLLIGGLAIRRPVHARTAHFTISLLLSVGLAAGLQLDRGRRVAIYGPEVAVNWALNDSALPNEDLRAVGTYVRRNTPPDTIIATNDFCCFGETWWQEISRSPEEHRLGTLNWWSGLEKTKWWNDLASKYGVDGLTVSVADTLWGGDNYLIAAETRRRVLIQGLKFQVLTGVPTQDQTDRMTVSLAFANNPNGDSANALKNYGVSGYIVNLRLTDQRSWAEFAEELFRSGDFVYLQLR